MKTYKIELETFFSCFTDPSKDTVVLNQIIQKNIDEEIIKVRKISINYKLLHFIAQLLPILFILSGFIFLLTNVDNLGSSLWPKALIFSLLHGILTYQFVVYTLHEGAGHGLFRSSPWMNKIAFDLSRLFFADPIYYKRRHGDHHRYLGTEKDGAFTHFVLPQRIITSLLPGAGILFPNDYKIAQPDKPSSSTYVSYLMGLLFVVLEIVIIGDALPIWLSLICLLILSPWISLFQDRIRESIEHCCMPMDSKFGSWELGLSLPAMLIGGGPWGQPCHFSHHLAPDFSWYQQLILHLKLKKLLPDEIAKRYGFGVAVHRRIFIVMKIYCNYLLKIKSKEVVI